MREKVKTREFETEEMKSEEMRKSEKGWGRREWEAMSIRGGLRGVSCLSMKQKLKRRD